MAFAPSISRWPRVHVLAAMLLAVPCLAAVDAPIIVDPEWTLVSADAGGLRLTWKNAQSGRYGSARSRSLAIAVPPGCVADAVLENPQAASASVAVSAPARFRDVFIAAVSFTPGIPASGNPSAGAAFAASAIAASATAASPTEPARIRITFRTAAQPGSYRSAFAPPESAPSENGLRGWLANYSQSRDLRSTPVQAALAKAGAEGPSPGATLPKRRLVIKTAGEAIQWLDYAALARAGLPLGDIDPRRMRLYCE
ncbi:MAG: hypothetical protein ABI036_12965, partial [Fibrobacteria bacterium]